MALTDYLKQRHRTWSVRVQIPPHLWAAAGGRREFVKSLKTRDLNKANQLKHAHVAVFKSRIRALEGADADTSADPLAELHSKALALRSSWERVKNEEPVYDERDVDLARPYYPSRDATEDAILDETRNVADQHGDAVAVAFLKIAKGEGTPLGDLVNTWLAEQVGTITKHTSAQHRTALKAFLPVGGSRCPGRGREPPYGRRVCRPTPLRRRPQPQDHKTLRIIPFLNVAVAVGARDSQRR
jgi:hypothetical protein